MVKSNQKQKKKTGSKCRLHAIRPMLLTHHYCANTNLKGIRCNFTEDILGT